MNKPKLEEYEVPSLSLDETNGMGVVILPIKQYFKVFRKEQLQERIELSFEELGDKMVLINHRKYIDREDMFKILKDNFEEILKE